MADRFIARKARPFVCWAILTSRVVPDIDLLVARREGRMHLLCESLHAGRPTVDLDACRPVLHPGEFVGLTNDLACFDEFLGDHHPGVARIAYLERRHIESFFQWPSTHPWRREMKPGKTVVSSSAAAHNFTPARTFLDDTYG